MAEALKDKHLNTVFYKTLCRDIKQVYPSLNEKKFYQDCVKPLEQLELKQRITHTTLTVARHLPQNYKKAIKVLYAFKDGKGSELGYLFMPEFVARFGLNDFELSMNALRDFTEHSSAEFAIRDFLQRDFAATFDVMLQWAEHDNEHIRRLASEGSRPRLPWATQLPAVITNPALSWPVLELLKNDDAKYVQKSVANHLNDISKDHPAWLIKQLNNWNQSDKNTAWIINHGCRTLIKQGDKPTLRLLKIKKARIELTDFELHTDTITLGESLKFSFNLHSLASIPQQLVIDYRVHYLKKNDTHTQKTFKLKTFRLDAKEKIKIQKSHRFEDFSTRKHYPGRHVIEIFINGESQITADFMLKTDIY